MDLQGEGADVARFTAYLGKLASVIGHADRVGPLRDYCTGLPLPAERKSVEPMAAMTAPAGTAAQHQSLLQFVGKGNWSDEKVLAKVLEEVLPKIEAHGPITALILDDTSFPKKDSIRSGSRASIAVSSESRIMFKSCSIHRSHRWSISRPARCGH